MLADCVSWSVTLPDVKTAAPFCLLVGFQSRLRGGGGGRQFGRSCGDAWGSRRGRSSLSPSRDCKCDGDRKEERRRRRRRSHTFRLILKCQSKLAFVTFFFYLETVDHTFATLHSSKGLPSGLCWWLSDFVPNDFVLRSLCDAHNCPTGAPSFPRSSLPCCWRDCFVLSGARMCPTDCWSFLTGLDMFHWLLLLSDRLRYVPLIAASF